MNRAIFGVFLFCGGTVWAQTTPLVLPPRMAQNNLVLPAQARPGSQAPPSLWERTKAAPAAAFQAATTFVLGAGSAAGLTCAVGQKPILNGNRRWVCSTAVFQNPNWQNGPTLPPETPKVNNGIIFNGTVTISPSINVLGK